nr:5'-nucleotidase [Allomuricauda sp.]
MASCKQGNPSLSSIEGKQIPIDTSFKAIDSITSYISPFKKRVDEVLDSVLCYAPENLELNDGERNTSMGNFFADLVFEETAPIFQSKTGNSLDFVVLNRGGVRATVSKGPLTARNAYEIMPFENYISVVELDGTAVRKLILFLASSKKRHPISGIEIILDDEGGLEMVNIGGRPFDESRNYYVATSDYLVQGGADIGFFPKVESATDIGYLLRNAIVDHFRKKDTITGKVDNRFIQMD